LNEKSVFPSNQFGQTTKDALAKAGTVALPCPSPASGRLYLGINPDFDPHLAGGSPKFFLRLVQTVSARQMITRIVDLNELRGISLPRPPTKVGETAREFRTANGIAKEIGAATDSLTKAEQVERGVVHELCLFEDAVIYVRESAPVFVQIQYEFGVCAAEAAENVEFTGMSHYGCMCQADKPLLGGGTTSAYDLP
jgi:hypothetical protein